MNIPEPGFYTKEKNKWDEEYIEAMIDTKGMWLVERIEEGNRNPGQ